MFADRTRRLRLLTAVLLFPFAVTTSGAVAEETWTVEHKLLGKPKDLDGRNADKSTDVSGIACATTKDFPRVCLLADDETQGAQIVILEKDKLVAGSFIQLTREIFDKKPVELDAEGVAFSDGNFYVIGSHGRARHEKDDPKKQAKNDAKAKASRHLFRIRFDLTAVDRKGTLSEAVDVKPSVPFESFIRREGPIGDKFDVPLEDNGLTIEGLAARGRMLYVGMRGPVLDKGDAVILSMPLPALFDGETGKSHLDRLHLGTDTRGKARGIRDLVAFQSGFLVLAGPVNDPTDDEVKDGDYSVFGWDGGTLTPLSDLKGYGTKVKPEALVPLEMAGDKLRVLLLFDGPEEGAPRVAEIRKPPER